MWDQSHWSESIDPLRSWSGFIYNDMYSDSPRLSKIGIPRQISKLWLVFGVMVKRKNVGDRIRAWFSSLTRVRLCLSLHLDRNDRGEDFPEAGE